MTFSPRSIVVIRSYRNTIYLVATRRGPQALRDVDYRRLLALRSSLRRFLHWSEDQARRAGLTPAQHQLLLAVRGHPDGDPTVGELARSLLLRHHSVVELIDRAADAALVARAIDPLDHRVVRVRLTRSGASKLERLSATHLEEIARLAGTDAMWDGLQREGSPA